MPSDEPARLHRPCWIDADDCRVWNLAHARPAEPQFLPQRRGENALVGDWPFGDGDASQRDHFSFHARAGLSRRPWFSANLFWHAAGAHYDCGGFSADLPEAQCLYGLRVFGKTFRQKNAAAWRWIV